MNKNIIVLVVIMAIIGFLFLGWFAKNDGSIYESMTSIQDVSYSPEEDDFYLFFYYEGCKFCAAIEDETEAFYEKITTYDDVGFYVVDIKDPQNMQILMGLGMAMGTPTLFEYKDKKKVQEYVGFVDVPKAYDAIIRDLESE